MVELEIVDHRGKDTVHQTLEKEPKPWLSERRCTPQPKTTQTNNSFSVKT